MKKKDKLKLEEELLNAEIETENYSVEDEVSSLRKQLNQERSKIIQEYREWEKKWKEGMWQYLLDHSRPNQAGNHFVQINIRDKENFWKRVRSRVDGNYKVVNVEDEEDKATFLKAAKKEREFVDRLTIVEYEISKRGTFKDKILLALYKKLRDTLVNYK